MSQAPYSTLHDVPAVLRRIASRAAPIPPEVGEAPLRTADAMLAGLFDLPATIRMGDHLAIRAPRRSPAGGGTGRPGPLRARVDRKVAEIRKELSEGFRAPFEGKRAAPGRAEIFAALRDGGALGTRDLEKARTAARRLAPFHRERFDFLLSRGRQRIRWIRVDVTAELRSLGPDAAALEAFDTVFARAIEPGLAKLGRHLEVRLDAFYEDLLVSLVAALPEDATESHVGAWLDRRGPLHLHQLDLGALAIALVDHDIDALLALVDTAWASRAEEISA